MTRKLMVDVPPYGHYLERHVPCKNQPPLSPPSSPDEDNGSNDQRDICPSIQISHSDNCPFNQNIPEIDEFLVKWLSLFAQQLLDNDRQEIAKSLDLDHIRESATKINVRYRWTSVATTRMETFYTSEIERFTLPDGQERAVLAIVATESLRKWFDYATQHETKVVYSNNMQKEAHESAQAFYNDMKQWSKGNRVAEMFKLMCLNSEQEEAELGQRIPSYRPEIQRNPKHFGLKAVSTLRPDAPNFSPLKYRERITENSNEGTAASPRQLLDDYFSMTPAEKNYSHFAYSDAEVVSMSHHLERAGIEWSTSPRLYIVFRHMGLLDMSRQVLIDENISDANLPFIDSDLRHILDSTRRSKLMKMQRCVLTSGPDAEQCEKGGHALFADQNHIPFESHGILGAGGFAQVDRVTSRRSGKQYARKLILRRPRHSRGYSSHFETEIKILKKLKHKHVVEVVGSYTDPQCLAIIISPIADCDLTTFLERKDLDDREISLLRTFPGCLSTALRYLHSQKIRHKDIKPSNILIEGCRVLFTDFGIARDCNNVRNTTSGGAGAFTRKYCAPEVINQTHRSYPSDMWSFGCVLLEIFTVIQRHSLSELASYLEGSGDLSANYWSNTSYVHKWMKTIGNDEELREEMETPTHWIEDLLQHDTTKRPSASALALRIAGSRAAGGRGGQYCGKCCRNETDQQIF